MKQSGSHGNKGHIIIRGAREHNLKNISLDIPKNSLTVITGVSGSGKSSLAFDTIYAEGHRRYVESLSTYARQFLDQLQKPEVDSIDGLSPAISIEQRNSNKNPRSTVGTVTEIYDYLRLLYAKISRPYSPVTGEELRPQSSEEIVDRIMALDEGTKFILLAPIAIERKGEHRKELERAVKAGFSSAKVNGKIVDLENDISLDKQKKHNISIIIDRLVRKGDIRVRLSQSVATALKMTEGFVSVQPLDQGKEILFNTHFACPVSGVSFPAPEPRLFSFNSPVGACPACSGLGYKTIFDPDLIAPDKSLSIPSGALSKWCGDSSTSATNRNFQVLENLARHYKFDLSLPFYRLSEEAKKIIFFGTGKEEIQFKLKKDGSSYRALQPFDGIIADYEKRALVASPDELEALEELQAKLPCSACNGDRLKPETLAFRISGKNISEMARLSNEDLRALVLSLDLKPQDREIAKDILKEIETRLGFLINVGLSYISLSRPAGTLSGGEIQRVHLATQIGGSLIGVLYILDEPSIGLHQRDNTKLIDSLRDLQRRGNTVLVVEHDRDTMEVADFIVDMGPGAGAHGGEVISMGTPKEIINDPKSITGRFLRGKETISMPKVRRTLDWKRSILLSGCTENNLRDVTLKIPLGSLICVTGVSGSGKSSLILKTLVPAIRERIYRGRARVKNYAAIEGIDEIDKVINVDQSPIGRSPRSNPATYTGVFSMIRLLFSQTKDALVRGYKAGRFSFNVKAGRCQTCEGAGYIKVEMHFLPDVFIPCHVCGGARYNRETLSVKYKGKNIAEVLDMPVEEAYAFFQSVPQIEKFLKILVDVGLGYVRLGQSATTLSGGEAQRMKLAKELSKKPTGKTIYVMDEPSTGLHFQDIEKLLGVLHRLVDNGNTMIIIEHNLDIIKNADHIIDVGPEGGNAGGAIVYEGSPEGLLKVKESYTGKYLAPYLQ
jgi:excinuclease ABC subunit A